MVFLTVLTKRKQKLIQSNYLFYVRANDWKKILPREKTGLLPSYMDKNINTRSSITLLNLKTLEMNSTDLRKLAPKLQKQTKKPMQFIE